jgi:hypothetical protein
MKKNEELLRTQATGKEKCTKIMKDKYGKKPYMSSNLSYIEINSNVITEPLGAYVRKYTYLPTYSGSITLCRQLLTRSAIRQN